MKRLTLSATDKKIAGVCGGIAEYADIDPTVVRLVLVVLTIVTGIFPLLLPYLVAWVIIPTPQSP
jgi:phage shock protein PspC (stress-responsive transcriptional regulator)